MGQRGHCPISLCVGRGGGKGPFLQELHFKTSKLLNMNLIKLRTVFLGNLVQII